MESSCAQHTTDWYVDILLIHDTRWRIVSFIVREILPELINQVLILISSDEDEQEEVWTFALIQFYSNMLRSPLDGRAHHRRTLS